jgi:hypothetical protein
MEIISCRYSSPGHNLFDIVFIKDQVNPIIAIFSAVAGFNQVVDCLPFL